MEPIVIGDTPIDGDISFSSDMPPMELPRGAVLNDDGSVTLTLDYPTAIILRRPGSDAVARKEPVTQLVLRRLTGADVRKMLGARNGNAMALALSSGLGLARLNMLQQVMDATDEAAANNVIAELLGGFGSGLPSHAVETPDGVTLPLWQPTPDEEGNVHTEIAFKRITAAQRRQVSDAPNLLDWGISLSTGLTPKAAKSLVDAMDGADAVAVNHVILFLCGSGRRSGG